MVQKEVINRPVNAVGESVRIELGAGMVEGEDKVKAQDPPELME